MPKLSASNKNLFLKIHRIIMQGNESHFKTLYRDAQVLLSEFGRHGGVPRCLMKPSGNTGGINVKTVLNSRLEHVL